MYPSRSGAILAQVYGDVRLEAENGPFVPSQQVVDITQAGVVKLMQRSSSLIARDRGYTGVLPEFDLQYTNMAPGAFRLELSAYDPRPRWVQLLSPVPSRYRDELRRMLRWLSELLSMTVQLVPPIALADDIRVSASADSDGFGTLVLNNRRTYRVPVVMAKMFDGAPEMVDAVRNMLTALMIPELRSVVIVRDPLDPEVRQEVIVPLTEEFHARIIHEDFFSLFAKVDFEESPLSSVLTKRERRQSFDTGISGLEKPN